MSSGYTHSEGVIGLPYTLKQRIGTRRVMRESLVYKLLTLF